MSLSEFRRSKRRTIYILTMCTKYVNTLNTYFSQYIKHPVQKWGVAIFVLYFVQAFLGLVIHKLKPKNSVRRPPQNYMHAALGLLVIGLAFYQVRSGFGTEWPLKTGRSAPNAVNIVWYVWVVVSFFFRQVQTSLYPYFHPPKLLPVLYFAGLALLPRQFRQERQNRSKNIDESRGI